MTTPKIILLLIAIIVAYQIGALHGRQDCPVRAQQEAERRAAIDRDVSAMLASPTERDAVCGSIFEAVRGQIEREALDDSAARSGALP